ncbi:T9SS type A sorting domain-containing protein [Telluribacter humicola]|uniref:T9SS type A sorting domain-containing protein n=1 Tax=Telluribacter humicola TaxID=1720261 RepID=UPI001A9623A5|nr:T9SS type A sorting domain-containing protein [Telluribacter humicola]
MRRKRIVIPLLLSLSVPGLAISQSLSPEVIAVGGSIDKNENLSLEWTLGESAVETVGLPERFYTQGFHQPMLLVEALPDEAVSLHRVEVYPNPVSSILTVKIESGESVSAPLKLSLIDVTGTSLLNKAASAPTETLQLDLKQAPAGMYMLQVITAEGQPVRVFKIVKQ